MSEELIEKYQKILEGFEAEEGEISLEDLEETVREAIKREGYSVEETEADQVIELVRNMLAGKVEGDEIILSIRSRGKGIETFKL